MSDTMSNTVRAPFRLAIRAEGDFINAYFAAPTTMDGAMLLGSIKRSVCDKDRSLFDKFRELMEGVINCACVEVLGEEAAEMIQEPAPEHERSGRA